MIRRSLALTAVAVTVATITAPRAATDPTPPVDDTFLPAPADPAPPVATEQMVSCSLPSLTAGADPRTLRSPLDDAALQEIWRLSTGDGQTVAVIDTGVSPHSQLPDLSGGGDYVSTGDGTDDCDGHGTIVAGIIGANRDPSGENGFAGLAPDVSLLSIRQSTSKFGARGSDRSQPGFGDVVTMAMAVRTAADLGAGVINISSVACVAESQWLDDRALGAALAYAVDAKDAVVVSAAGNINGPSACPTQNPGNRVGGQPVPDWTNLRSIVTPGRYDDYVLTVGSVNSSGTPSTFTLAGPWVDVAAPGESIVSLDPDGHGLVNATAASDGGRPITGTSYAAPFVSAVAALVRSRFPELTAREVMRRIEDTAQPGPAGWDPFVGNGTVDPLAAISSQIPDTATTIGPKSQPLEPARTVTTDDPAQRTALVGAGLCVVALVAILALRWMLRRWRGLAIHGGTGGTPHTVAGHQRIGPAELGPPR